MRDLDAIKKRCDAASDGPWFHRSYGEKCYADQVITMFTARDGDMLPENRSNVELEHWDDDKGEYVNDYLICDEICNAECQPGFRDLSFIAHAREDIPALVSEVERLRKALGMEESTRLKVLAGIERVANMTENIPTKLVLFDIIESGGTTDA